MAESFETRGLRNLVQADLDRIDREGRIGPLLNHDGSMLTPKEWTEVHRTVERAREAVKAHG